MSDPAPHSHPTQPRLLVLHTLRCIGVAELARVADAAGLTERDTESELIDLGAGGLVAFRAGAFAGWGITDTGRAVDTEAIAREMHDAGVREAVTGEYQDFLVLNPELLEVCTAWQTRIIDDTLTINDHSDRTYDAQVLGRLGDVHMRAEIPIASLGNALRRFQRYRSRLADALTKAKAGASEYVTDGTASYHTVWFQLHEDLLVTLGIPRY